MGLFRKIFGPSKKEVWRQFAEEIGAEFVDGGFWKGNKVVARVEDWTITLDTYTVSTGQSSITYTRLRAPFVNRDGFRFAIYRKGPLSKLGKALGMQDIEVGYPELDREFIIKGNDQAKVHALFSNERMRELIRSQRSIRLQIKEIKKRRREGLPEGTEELHFQVTGVIKDIPRLKSLYELFALTLNRLCQMGSASGDDPGANV